MKRMAQKHLRSSSARYADTNRIIYLFIYFGKTNRIICINGFALKLVVAGHGISVVGCFESIGNHLKPIVSADFLREGILLDPNLKSLLLAL